MIISKMCVRQDLRSLAGKLDLFGEPVRSRDHEHGRRDDVEQCLDVFQLIRFFVLDGRAVSASKLKIVVAMTTSLRETHRINPVELLRRQYLQCLSPESLALPKPELLRMPEVQNQLFSDMFDESRLLYPPPVRYRFRVLKRILAALEQAIEDPEEDVCTFLRAAPFCLSH